MEYVIKNREPADVLRYFEEISAIPRGSGNEKAIGEYLLDFAAKLGLADRFIEFAATGKKCSYGRGKGTPRAVQVTALYFGIGIEDASGW